MICLLYSLRRLNTDWLVSRLKKKNSQSTTLYFTDHIIKVQNSITSSPSHPTPAHTSITFFQQLKMKCTTPPKPPPHTLNPLPCLLTEYIHTSIHHMLPNPKRLWNLRWVVSGENMELWFKSNFWQIYMVYSRHGVSALAYYGVF